MIFATVGTQLPFDRLVDALRYVVDSEQVHIFAQTINNNMRYNSIGTLECVETLCPSDYDQHFLSADVVISHAGIGSIISASRFQKPIILIPRRFDFGEHRNNHQLDTVEKFSNVPGIYVAENPFDLLSLIKSQLRSLDIPSDKNSSLVSGLRKYIHGIN